MEILSHPLDSVQCECDDEGTLLAELDLVAPEDREPAGPTAEDDAWLLEEDVRRVAEEENLRRLADALIEPDHEHYLPEGWEFDELVECYGHAVYAPRRGDLP